MEVFVFLLVVFSASLRPGELRSLEGYTSSQSPVSPGTLDPDTCAECSHIMEITAEKGLSNDTQEVLLEDLKQLCGRRPVNQRDPCTSHLPHVTQLNPHEVCKVLGLCALDSELETVRPAQVLPEVSTPAFNPDSIQFSPQCTLCLFLIRKMEDMLPKNRTEEAVVKLMGQVCDLLHGHYKSKCNNFIDKYGKQIVEFLLSSAAPHSICALLHLCLMEETSPAETPPPSSDCESCRHLVVLGRLHPGLNSSRPAQASAFLESVCLHHPNAIPKCEIFLKHFGSRLQRVLGNQLDTSDPCERAELCVAVRETSRTAHCNLGPSYWCQDVKTAQMCGNLAYCKKHMWK